MASVAATLVETEESGSFRIAAGGDWLVATAGELDQRLRAIQLPSGERVTLDLQGIDRLDTAGAWLLLRTEHELKARGNAVEICNLRSNFAPLFDQVRAGGMVAPAPHPRPAHHTIIGFLSRLGEASVGLVARAIGMLGFFGVVCVATARILAHPRRLRLTALVAQMEQTGVNAVPIVGLLAFLIGIVLAYQGADQLRRFGAEIYTVNLLGIGILRELGVIMAAIIIAGRSGSAFTAQIGTMQVNEEIDALRTIGLDPVEVLVIPRLFGLMLTLPMLTLCANLFGILGGYLMAWGTLGITPEQFTRQLQSSLYLWTFWIGLIKAPFFAFIIALTGCFEGFQVARSAESVGRLTTLSVVEAIFLVIVADAAFSVVFSILRI
ncbi:MAG TPA: MlaE family lipid ABC transporter permease subunit [Stellaceae bacterium]|nr:MlaE family lipid ABC transporter permease subunit [Stellaceae bacterium]